MSPNAGFPRRSEIVIANEQQQQGTYACINQSDVEYCRDARHRGKKLNHRNFFIFRREENRKQKQKSVAKQFLVDFDVYYKGEECNARTTTNTVSKFSTSM